jgi:hypothetical protein
MADKETWSLWDHITGECFQGENQGKQLDVYPIHLTTVAAALTDYPDLSVSLSHERGIYARFMQWLNYSRVDGKGFMPPGFRRTMASQIDGRLDKMTQGLGVIVNGRGKFYPMNALPKGQSIEDVWLGRPIRVERGSLDGIPRATWQDSGDSPMQLLSRWYGFSFTYPGCEIYGIEDQTA